LQPTPIISIVAEEIVVINIYDPGTCCLQVSDISTIKIKTLQNDHDLWSLLTCDVNQGLDMPQSVGSQNSVSGPSEESQNAGRVVTLKMIFRTERYYFMTELK
jgi:hypothetical protein